VVDDVSKQLAKQFKEAGSLFETSETLMKGHSCIMSQKILTLKDTAAIALNIVNLKEVSSSVFFLYRGNVLFRNVDKGVPNVT
jgi:hypothetical protein